MKTTLLTIAALACYSLLSYGQVTIAAQDFEPVPAAPVWNFSDYQGTSTFLDSLSLVTESPASSPFGEDTTRAWETTQQSAGVIIEFDNVDISAYSNVYITYRVAAFSVGTNSNGPDALDYVIPYISVDGGTTWYQRKRITGNSNNSWEYTATAVATDTFATANNTYAYAPAGSGLRTTDGYSTAIIYIPNGYTQVKLRIDSRESTAQERWCVDNVAVRGDLTGCSASASVVSPVLCHGDCNAAASVTASGIAPFTYLWSAAGQTGQTATGLCAGMYTLTVTDSTGCIATDTISITEPDSLVAVTSVLQNVSCNGYSDGIAAVASTGGTLPYNYLWTPSGGTDATMSNVPAGCYTVTVTDNNGCSTTATVCITEPPPLGLGWGMDSSFHCAGDTVCAWITAGGGTPAYTYLWTPAGGNTQSLCTNVSGTYTITVTDANGCTVTDSITYTQPAPVTVSLSVTDASCSSCCDGVAIATASNGVPPYTYSWSPGNPATATATFLCPGIYTSCVTDANGCTTCTSDTVFYPTLAEDIPFNDGFSIHPNPFSEKLIVHLAANTAAILTLYDYTGKIILYRKSFMEETIINTEGIAEGIYLLRVESRGGVKNYKVIKQ